MVCGSSLFRVLVSCKENSQVSLKVEFPNADTRFDHVAICRPTTSQGDYSDARILSPPHG